MMSRLRGFLRRACGRQRFRAAEPEDPPESTPDVAAQPPEPIDERPPASRPDDASTPDFDLAALPVPA